MHRGEQIHSYTTAYRNRISNAMLSGAVIMRAMCSQTIIFLPQIIVMNFSWNWET